MADNRRESELFRLLRNLSKNAERRFKQDAKNAWRGSVDTTPFILQNIVFWGELIYLLSCGSYQLTGHVYDIDGRGIFQELASNELLILPSIVLAATLFWFFGILDSD